MRRGLATATLALLLLSSTTSRAAGKAETEAKAALKKAVAQFQANDFDGALARLEKALERCGASGCSAATKGALVRDVGVMHLRKAEREAAANSFVEALRLDPRLELNEAYDAPDLRAEWTSAKDEASMSGGAQPGGDFIHSPAEEQKVNTPLPVFVGHTGSGKVARVVLKYKSETARGYRAVPLAKRNGGWGGLVPCAAVERGVMRYYLEGFDSEGDPVASSGSASEPFFVPIRWQIAGSAPSLPGSPPPKTCGDKSEPEEAPDAPKRTHGDDEEETSETRATPRPAPAAPPPGTYARWWIGVESSIDLVSLPGGTDVCKLTSAAVPANSMGYYCTNPRDDSDYPTRASTGQNASLASGNAGSTNGGIAARDWRVLLAVDYALSASALLGVRLGYVFGTYPGQAAVSDHHAFGSPLHGELRGTYLFGDAPLAELGFSPYVSGGLGVAELDAQTTVFVRQSNIVGSIPLQAWITGGPFFVDVGAGLRYAFSLRSAFSLGARGALAFGGGGGILPTVAPELAFAYGF